VRFLIVMRVYSLNILTRFNLKMERFEESISKSPRSRNPILNTTLDSPIFEEFPQKIIADLLQKLNEMIKDTRTVFGSSNVKSFMLLLGNA
jgi:hypothetical protein